LHCYQPHLPANVIYVIKVSYEGLVTVSIPFQSRDSVFNGPAKSGTDFETFSCGAIGNHSGLLCMELLRLKIFLEGRPQVFLIRADINEDP
jgi:hypothetical protein